MATEVYTTEEVRLMDETEVELRPLPISKQRKFMRMWTDHMEDISNKIRENREVGEDETLPFSEADMTDAQFDVFIKMAALGLESQLKGERTTKEFLSYLEDVLDEQTLYRVLNKTGGLSLGKGNEDPNPLPQTTPGAGGN